MAASETTHTQEQTDRLVPKLIEQGGDVHLRLTPREDIDLRFGHGDEREPSNARPFVERADLITRVTVTGDEQPLHPDWVRSLRDQCAAAGVEFVFESWGDWLPYEHSDQYDPPAIAIDNPPIDRIGRAHSGNLLDGVRHLPKEEAGI